MSKRQKANILGAALQENLSSRFPARSNTNRAVQPQKMARGMKFQIYEVEALYYLCSENKGAGQLLGFCAADLCGYRTRAADLCLCFRICKKAGFPVT